MCREWSALGREIPEDGEGAEFGEWLYQGIMPKQQFSAEELIVLPIDQFKSKENSSHHLVVTKIARATGKGIGSE